MPLRLVCKQSLKRCLHKLEPALRIETLSAVTAEFGYVDALLFKSRLRRVNKAVDLKSQKVVVSREWRSFLSLAHGVSPSDYRAEETPAYRDRSSSISVNIR
jgi:hypothetical protein